MPRRSLLKPAERAELFAFPVDEADLIRCYTLSASDLSIIQQRRGDHNRLGFTVLLCCLRHPGFILPPDTDPPFPLLAFIGQQLQISPDVWSLYAQRAQTRREHLVELQGWLQLTLFCAADYRRLSRQLSEFLNRLGEVRDRSFENQRYRASGLNLVVAAIVLWNTVYIERAVQSLRDSGKQIDETLLSHLSPLGWEHILLTGDYIWPQTQAINQGQFRPLRTSGEA